MSETSNTELIEEARSRINANRLGQSWARETDKDLLVIKRLATALGAAATTLTETEDDLQAARAVIKRAHDNATHLADAQQSWIDAGRHEQAVSREAIRDRANEIAAILETVPSPALEAVEADTVTVPRPHVPFGPMRVPENEADADYLRAAVKNIRYAESNGRGLFGSNLTNTVCKLLNDVADALDRTCPDCGANMDLVSMSPDGSGCDWLCWLCWYIDNPTQSPRPEPTTNGESRG